MTAFSRLSRHRDWCNVLSNKVRSANSWQRKNWPTRTNCALLPVQKWAFSNASNAVIASVITRPDYWIPRILMEIILKALHIQSHHTSTVAAFRPIFPTKDTTAWLHPLPGSIADKVRAKPYTRRTWRNHRPTNWIFDWLLRATLSACNCK
jgi:hypothetical protein